VPQRSIAMDPRSVNPSLSSVYTTEECQSSHPKRSAPPALPRASKKVIKFHGFQLFLSLIKSDTYSIFEMTVGK
jgi:hypothetical protein